jgi:hypothetical protein
LKTLYIHIGAHKTGTTSIQYGLEKNRKILEQNEIYYFTGGRDNFHSFLTFDNMDEGFYLKDKNLIEKVLMENKLDNVIISSENFSFFFSIERIIELKNLFSNYFDEIKIITYLRRQDQHLVSHHQEGSKINREPEYQLWGCEPTALPKFMIKHALYLNYNKRIGMWADIFGDKNIIIKIFDNELLYKNDVFCDFLKILHLKSDYFDIPERRNISFGYHRSKYGHYIVKNVSNKLLASRLTMVLPNNGRFLPSYEEKIEYLNYFKQCNASLNKRFKISTEAEIFSSESSAYVEIKDIAPYVYIDFISSLAGHFDKSDLINIASILQKQKNNLLFDKFKVFATKLYPDLNFKKNNTIKHKLHQFYFHFKNKFFLFK